MASEVDELRALLREGTSAGEAAQNRRRLGLEEDADDHAVGRRLVHRLSGSVMGDKPKKLQEDPRPIVAPRPVAGADTSFLGRLKSEGKSGGLAVEELDDARTILAVLRAGSLRQRRAAAKRITQLLTGGKKVLPSDQLKRIADVLPRIRDVEIEYELSEARAHLPGSTGRDFQLEREQFERAVAEIERKVSRYWDDEISDEPFVRLASDQRALLTMRVRDLPDPVVDHLGSILEGGERLLNPEDCGDILSSLRFCGDPRLVPSLIAVLDDKDAENAVDAARALGRIDDPRVHPALVSAFQRSVVDRNKVVLAASLGRIGDARGRDYVRGLLSSSDDPDVIRRAIGALEVLGTPEDADAVAAVLAEADGRTRVRAIRTVGAIGDGRALHYLKELREMTSVSAIWAEVEDAEAAIRARLELRGESEGAGASISVTEKEKLTRKVSDPIFVRFWSYKDYFLGVMWLFLGGIDRAVARFERAATRRSDWAQPLLRIALAHARKDHHALALAAFRRAIEIDRESVEHNPTAMRALATVFLRRADEVEDEGRYDIARGLIEEVTGLDLRRAPSALRFEVTRRYEAVRRGVG